MQGGELVVTREFQPSVADLGGGISACCTAGLIFGWLGQRMVMFAADIQF